MLTVLRNSWALLLGMLLLMLGNGMQGTLLGIRGGIEGFTTTQMSYVMAAYFLGFLFGSPLAVVLMCLVQKLYVEHGLENGIRRPFRRRRRHESGPPHARTSTAESIA